MKAYLAYSEPVTENSKTFWFTPERPLRYQAGQYLELLVPHAPMDTRGDRRWFSLSSSPTEPLLSITTTLQKQGGSSYKQALLALQPDGAVSITDPLGDFVLPRDPAIPLLFIAAGIGITPVRSIITWLIDTGEQRHVQLVYITRTPAGMAFLPQLARYPSLEILPIHTKQLLARPTASDLVQTITGLQEKRIYLSGPESLAETWWRELLAYGIAREQLVLDYFPGYDEL